MNKLYMVQSVDGGPVKIGVSSDPIGRLKVMQTGCPLVLQFIALRSESMAYTRERELHNKYAEYRLHGEWFTVSDDLLAEANSIGIEENT